MSKPVVLIVGATGLLGPYFVEEFSHDYTVIPTGHSKGGIQVDLTDANSTRELLSKIKPEIVINLAAYTDVEGCEQNLELATALNTTIPQNLATYMHENSFFLQISTDQVYADVSGPHTETNPKPINIYSQTKLNGEEAALKHSKTLVLRTNMFGESKTSTRESISDFFIKNFKTSKPLKLFGDAIFAPLHMQTLAKLSKDLIEKEVTGVFNAGSNNALSKADFALAIAKHCNLPTAHTEIVESQTFTNRTKRPLDVSLDMTKLEKVLGYKLPTLTEEINKL